MQRTAPSFGRILTMVLFALSCFGLTLFLWVSFGGPVPFKPKGYQVQVAFPEATQLGLEADVRVAGVSVGKVRKKELDPAGNRTLTTLEIKRQYAPIHKDALAILRQKTLLGETYVELTPGTKKAGWVKEGGRLANGQVKPAVELDEIYNALDGPTREAFHIWQKELAKGIRGHGRDLGDALGNLPGVATNGADTLDVLNRQAGEVQRLFRDGGVVFGALAQDETALRNLITNSQATFGATASQNVALAQAFKIFPTFLDESKKTFVRLESFARDTHPLIRDLKPVGRDLKPTLHAVRLLAPDLRSLFIKLNPLIRVSKTGLPALTEILTGAKPLFGSTGEFLAQLNPILEWLELYQHQVADFITNGSAALAGTTRTLQPGGIGHYLRQNNVAGLETVGMYPVRLPSNRGNAYPEPVSLAGRDPSDHQIFANWDCKPSGGPVQPSAVPPTPACWVRPRPAFQGKSQGQFAHVNKADYSK